MVRKLDNSHTTYHYKYMQKPTTIIRKPRELTTKQRAFIKELVDNPKKSATQAALKAYDTDSPQVAQAIASENLSKPMIRSELAKYNGMLESALINTVDEWKDHERPRQREIAMDVAKYVHDKIHGKATQKVETRSESLEIHIDLTSSESG